MELWQELPAREPASVVSAGNRLVSVALILLPDDRMLTPAGYCLVVPYISSVKLAEATGPEYYRLLLLTLPGMPTPP